MRSPTKLHMRIGDWVQMLHPFTEWEKGAGVVVAFIATDLMEVEWDGGRRVIEHAWTLKRVNHGILKAKVTAISGLLHIC